MNWDVVHRDTTVPVGAVYIDDTIQDAYLCKVTVTDNDLPGRLSIGNAYCQFVYEDSVAKSDLYRALVMTDDSQLVALWVDYETGTEVPVGAFIAGLTSQGTPLYPCRIHTGGTYEAGYYDPVHQRTAIHAGLLAFSGVAAGHLERPSHVQILTFIPDGPISAGPPGELQCPRSSTRIANLALQWVVYDVYTSSLPDNVATDGEGIDLPTQFSNVGELPGKYVIANQWYFAIYNDKLTMSSIASLLCKIDDNVTLSWVPYTAGGTLPENAIIMSYSSENHPLYSVRSMAIGGGSSGYYDGVTEGTVIEYYGINRPTDVEMMTFNYPHASRGFHWSDAGYSNYSGTITAIRIQQGATIHGLRCRFGAHWSTGFWNTNNPDAMTTELTLASTEYLTGVNVTMDQDLSSLTFITNLAAYGPYGRATGRQQMMLSTQCGQLEYFSGRGVWNDIHQENRTVSFAVHGQTCA